MQEIISWLEKQERSRLGDPLFRLVFSDHEVEMRKGEFREFHGDIYLRTFKGTKEVPKYPYIKGRWVLEIWVSPELAFCDELPHSNRGSYEPFYVFEDANGNSLPVTIKVIEFIIGRWRRGPVKSPEPEEVETIDPRIEEAMDSSSILNALAMGEGIGYGKNRKRRF